MFIVLTCFFPDKLAFDRHLVSKALFHNSSKLSRRVNTGPSLLHPSVTANPQFRISYNKPCIVVFGVDRPRPNALNRPRTNKAVIRFSGGSDKQRDGGVRLVVMLLTPLSMDLYEGHPMHVSWQ